MEDNISLALHTVYVHRE